MLQSINFKELANFLQPYVINILTEHTPGGRQEGREYKASSIYGGPGGSFSFNLDNQKWADFATQDHQGGDIISLVATVKSIKQIDAAKLLAEQYGFVIDNSSRNNIPNCIDRSIGKPEKIYIYKNIINQPTHLVVRYVFDTKNTKGKFDKTFRQWHFDDEQNKWIPKQKSPTPLYKLDQIHAEPDKKIVVCEGEKSADAAQVILGSKYITTCWIGGSQKGAIKKANFTNLTNRDVILWADADTDGGGLKAMAEVSSLISHLVKTLKIIKPLPTDPDSFDAANLLELGLSQSETNIWLLDRIKQLKPLAVSEAKATSSSQVAVLEPDSETATHLHVDTLSPFDQSRAQIMWQDYGLQMKSQYKVFENEANAYKILKKSPLFSDNFYFDTFRQCFMTTFGSPAPIEVNKDITTRVKIYLQQYFYFGNISTEAVKNAMGLYLSECPKINSMKNLISTYEWDKTPRVDTFFADIMGADDNAYTKAASRIFWLQMVKRIIEPGSKADIMVIMEGAQGIKKSTALEIIGGNFFAVAGQNISNKDFYIKLKGKFLIEMGELNTFTKADHNHLKEVMSTRVDNFRDLFQSDDTPHPRTCVFVGTTNERYYLKDETGNRRYLPVECRTVNTTQLKDNLNQYFSEAYSRIQHNEDYWTFPAEEHKAITDDRSIDLKDEDPWFNTIEEWVKDIQNVLTISILQSSLGIHDNKYHTKRESNRIGKIMKQLGYKKGNLIDVNKNWKIGWISNKDNCLFKNCAEKVYLTPGDEIRYLEAKIQKVKEKAIFG